MAHEQVLDVIGVGVGPFNLGMAALLEPTSCTARFFERNDSFQWHPGMMLAGTTLQVPFLADLVTMIDPTSTFSFLQYLHAHSRLYQFYFLEHFHIPREEYNHYCQWVARQLSSLQFSSEVEQIVQREDGVYEVHVREQGNVVVYQAKHIVVGIGTAPHVPKPFQPLLGENVFHSAQYTQKDLSQNQSITVVGSGQSAAEIFYDLLQKQVDYDYKLQWFTQSKGFYPMEYSKLGLEHFSPEYTKYFHGLETNRREEVLVQQSLLYKGISFDTIAAIYDLLYERTVGGKKAAVHLQALTRVEHIEREDGYVLTLYQTEQQKTMKLRSDVVILGTGYRERHPSFLVDIPHVKYDMHHRFDITENYRVKRTQPSCNHIFVQNGELHTHGVGAPDLGLGAYRNAVIINQIANEEVYTLYEKNVFQQFGI